MAKRYVHEAGSAGVRRQLRTGRIATSRLSAIEIVSALARRQREGAFTVAERDRAVRRLNADLGACILVELSPELTADAQALLLKHGLRSGDAVQLASCLYLQRETGERISFAAFDDRLTTAARAEGLTGAARKSGAGHRGRSDDLDERFTLLQGSDNGVQIGLDSA